MRQGDGLGKRRAGDVLAFKHRGEQSLVYNTLLLQLIAHAPQQRIASHALRS